MRKTPTMNSVARFVLCLFPQMNNHQTLFNVVASLWGDRNSTAKATHTLPNGIIYTVCQTIQYNYYKPSTNSIAVTIMPQITIDSTVLKSQKRCEIT